MFAYGIFEVIYSPSKAFKEIVKNPKYTGPFLILILFILASTGSEYTRASKFYVQRTLPSTLDPYNPDPWTENCTMWISDANIACNTDDYISGYKSIQFNIINHTKILMELDNIGQINCSGINDYKNLTLGIKWIHPTGYVPTNASLRLFSTVKSDHLYRDLTQLINQTENDKWSNFTISLGPDAEQWTSSNADTVWNNITGLRLELDWSESGRANLTILVDRLYFQSNNFEPLINFMGSIIVVSAFNAAATFSIYWLILGAAMFIAAKVFRVKAEFKIFLIIVGYALIAAVVMHAVLSIIYLLMSPVYISLDVISPISVLQTIVLFGSSMALLLPIWSIILASVGMHTAFDLSLRKSAVIAIIGFLPYYILLLIA